MRTQFVFTNLTCNQNCGYCNRRSEEEERAFIAPAAVRRRIDATLSAGVEELVLTGGEPLLRRDIAPLVAYVRSKSDARIVLETNGTLVSAEVAEALSRAGLGRVRVNLSGVGKSLDALTQDPGGSENAFRGIAALFDAGIRVEIAISIVRSTLASVLDVIPRVLEVDAGRKLFCGVVVRVPVESPNPQLLVSFPEAAEVIVALESIARLSEIPIRLSPDAPIPPCVFPPKSRVTHLFSMTRGVRRHEGMRQVEACRSCQVAEACVGLHEGYLAQFGVPPMRPVQDDRTRRRLTIISSVEEQMRREFLSPNHTTHVTFGAIEEEIIRVQFHCNQSCRFCFVSTHLPAMSDAAIREAIEAAGRRGARIVLSGGEPTLNPRLAEYLRLATQVSRYEVQLQSNAVKLDDKALVRTLKEAGLSEAFISLHGTTAEISDAVTEAPGTFARTVVGIDNLHEEQIHLIINFVICERNMHDLPNLARLIAARWPKALLNVSFVAPSSDVVPRDRSLVPRYAEALPYVAEAVREAERLSVPVIGFESMCGIPLCLVPASLAPFFTMAEIPPGFDRGEFVKTSACQECDLSTRCYGLRVGYRQLHGEDELRPVRA